MTDRDVLNNLERLLAAIPKAEKRRDEYAASGKIGESASYDRWVTQAHLDLHAATRPVLPELIQRARQIAALNRWLESLDSRGLGELSTVVRGVIGTIEPNEAA